MSTKTAERSHSEQYSFPKYTQQRHFHTKGNKAKNVFLTNDHHLFWEILIFATWTRNRIHFRQKGKIKTLLSGWKANGKNSRYH